MAQAFRIRRAEGSFQPGEEKIWKRGRTREERRLRDLGRNGQLKRAGKLFVVP